MNKILLSEVCDYKNISTEVRCLTLSNFITTDNMLPNRGGIVDAVNLPPASSCPKFEKGDILLSNIRPYFKKIWYATFDGGCSTDVLVLKCKNDKFYSKYIFYNLFQDLFFKHMMNGAKGSKMPRGDKDQIMLFKIIEYPKEYQKLIADYLSYIDEKIRLNNLIKIEIEQIAKTIYNYWFVQFDFPNENGNPYKSSGGQMDFKDELKREIPKGWGVGTFNDVADIIGGSTPSTSDKTNFTINGTAWITPKDLAINEGKKFITKGEIDVSEKGLTSASLKIMPAGTILLSSRAPIGYMAISRNSVTTNQGFKSFIPKEGYTCPFIFYTVKSYIPTFVKKASGSTFKEISGDTLKDIFIVLPPEPVITKFSNILFPFFENQDLLELENQELSAIRDFLLPLFLNGQLKIMSYAEKSKSKNPVSNN